MWTTVLRSKLEHDKSSKGRRQNEVKRDAATPDNTGDIQPASATATGYMPPWFDRYVEYKFNLLDRAGEILSTAICTYLGVNLAQIWGTRKGHWDPLGEGLSQKIPSFSVEKYIFGLLVVMCFLRMTVSSTNPNENSHQSANLDFYWEQYAFS